MTIRLIFTVFILTVITSGALAQSTAVDTELWLRAGVKYKMSDRWRLAGEQQIRFDEGVEAIKNYHTEIGLSYAMGERFRLIGTSRFIRRNDNKGKIQGYENHFRYQGGVRYDHTSGRVGLKYRALYQRKNQWGVKASEGDIAKAYFRYRISALYNIKNWKPDPEVRFEFFHGFNQKKAGTNNSFRLSVGTEYATSLGEIGIRYMYERTLLTNYNEAVHIMFLAYTYVIR